MNETAGLHCINFTQNFPTELEVGDRIIIISANEKRQFMQILRYEADASYTELSGIQEIDATIDVLRVKLCRARGLDPRGLFLPSICNHRYNPVVDELLATFQS